MLSLGAFFVGPFRSDGTHVDKYTRNYKANSYIHLSLLFYVWNSSENDGITMVMHMQDLIVF